MYEVLLKLYFKTTSIILYNKKLVITSNNFAGACMCVSMCLLAEYIFFIKINTYDSI